VPEAGLEARPAIDLALAALSKRFGAVNALDSVDLRVEAGEFLTLLGPSGSGKTTLLRLLAGFEIPSAGSISLGGREVSTLPPAQRDIGMVFQHYALFPHLNVAENIGYGLKMRGWRKERRAERVRQMLDLVRLPGLADRMPKQLSGGQQQRVALARALAFRPALLLMDEPLGALDRTLRIEMAEEIRRIHREFGTTVVYVTHDREEAWTLSDRIAIMRNGHILALDTPVELYYRPPSGFVGSFFGGHNVVQASVCAREGNRVRARALGADVLVPAGGMDYGRDEAVLVIPLKKIALASEADPAAIAARVVEKLFLGDVTQLTCMVHEERVLAHVDSRAAAGVLPGDGVRLSIAWSDSMIAPAI
jgi:putative spermidine/putrescine transport system ATP-binding protein